MPKKDFNTQLSAALKRMMLESTLQKVNKKIDKQSVHTTLLRHKKWVHKTGEAMDKIERISASRKAWEQMIKKRDDEKIREIDKEFDEKIKIGGVEKEFNEKIEEIKKD